MDSGENAIRYMRNAPSKTRTKAIVAPGLGLPDHSLGPDPVAGVDPVCEDAPYPRLEPGKYDAECIEVRIYRDPQFRSWKCRLKYSVLPEGLVVYGFFHLGKGDGPHVGARSEYRRAWIIANGEQPRKRQTVSGRVFTKKIFLVEIGDVTRRFDGRDHPPGQVYSTVKQIVRRLYP
jgi:hypothetical protein